MPRSNSMFRGAYTALVTPMKASGEVDFEALNAVIDFQLDNGIHGLVPCGTTGETATLTTDEWRAVVSATVKRADGKVPVLAGTGSNSTAKTIEVTRQAKELGADVALVVTPYYNKPSSEGMYRHYEALTEAVDIPVMVYNVPGRTGTDLRPDVLAHIATLKNIIGIKEASADITRVTALLANGGDKFSVLSGDDPTCCGFMLMGGHGVISVASNIAPGPVVKMTEAALNNAAEDARSLHHKYFDLFEDLFLESNPIPVKAAMAMKGLIQENYRLPLCAMGESNRSRLRATLSRLNLI